MCACVTLKRPLLSLGDTSPTSGSSGNGDGGGSTGLPSASPNNSVGVGDVSSSSTLPLGQVDRTYRQHLFPLAIAPNSHKSGGVGRRRPYTDIAVDNNSDINTNFDYSCSASKRSRPCIVESTSSDAALSYTDHSNVSFDGIFRNSSCRSAVKPFDSAYRRHLAQLTTQRLQRAILNEARSLGILGSDSATATMSVRNSSDLNMSQKKEKAKAGRPISGGSGPYFSNSSSSDSDESSSSSTSRPESPNSSSTPATKLDVNQSCMANALNELSVTSGATAEESTPGSPTTRSKLDALIVQLRRQRGKTRPPNAPDSSDTTVTSPTKKRSLPVCEQQQQQQKSDTSSSTATLLPTTFTAKQMAVICQKLCQREADDIRTQFEQILVEKLSDQHAAFVQYIDNQIRDKFNSPDSQLPSYLS